MEHGLCGEGTSAIFNPLCAELFSDTGGSYYPPHRRRRSAASAPWSKPASLFRR